MYKLIIADDEEIIQEGLSNLVDWKELGFEIVGIFEDGNEVIDFLNGMHVDVVLTDIKMTYVGGIEIARYVMEAELPCKVVLISGHKEFELAVQAIKYGVEDYILKPSKMDEIKKVFRKIRTELDIKAKDIEFQQREKARWAQAYPLLEEKFVNGLIMGSLDDREDIRKRVQFLYPEIDAEQCPCILADLEIEDYTSYMQKYWIYSSEQLDDAVYNFVQMFKSTGFFHVIYKYKGRLRLFVIMKEYGMSVGENRTICETVITGFVREFMEVFKLNISVEINMIFENIYQVAGRRKEIINASKKQDNLDLQLQEQKKLILTNIMLGNIYMAQKILKSILKSMEGDDIHYCRSFVVDVFACISNLLQEKNLQLYRSIQPFIDYHSILNMSAVSELETYCGRIFDTMKLRDDILDGFDKDSLIGKIKDYVQNHITEDLSLERVAGEMFISTIHLNRIFKKQTGETFLQYVTKKKMEKAVELLHDPHYKVYQIGECLGYKTTRYFSKLFYNFMGYYPAEYRREVLMMGDSTDGEK